MSSVEVKWFAVTAVAPIAWGANYVVTRTWLPTDEPLWGAALRALPAGVVLLALARRLPRGVWWWRSALLGTVNIGAFFVLVYLASQLLPSSVAASVMALSPFALAGAGRLLLGEAWTPRLLIAAVAGVAGVLLLIGSARDGLSVSGLLASAAALALSATGSVLGKRWTDGTPVLASTAWQLVVGGGVLSVIALAVEGAPSGGPASTWVALAFTSLVATALAFWCWFAGLARLPAATVGVIGLLNPITGVALGAGVAHEHLGGAQLLGLGIAFAGIAVAVTPARTDPARSPAPPRSRRPVTSFET